VDWRSLGLMCGPFPASLAHLLDMMVAIEGVPDGSDLPFPLHFTLLGADGVLE
jgi:hypothetical protein